MRFVSNDRFQKLEGKYEQNLITPVARGQEIDIRLSRVKGNLVKEALLVELRQVRQLPLLEHSPQPSIIIVIHTFQPAFLRKVL
jgi:hypothetical protein